MKKIIAFLLPVVLAVMGLTNASAATALKIGVVDLPQILQSSPQVSSINAQLRNEFMGQQQKIINLQNNLRATSTKLSTGASKLTSDEQKKLQDEMASNQKELQQLIVNYQQQLSTAQTKAVNNFMSEVNNVVKNIAQQQNLDMVLMKPAVLFAPNMVDITSQVMQDLPKS
jgi:outer membrane protein